MSFILHLLRLIVVLDYVFAMTKMSETRKPMELCENIYTYYGDGKLVYDGVAICLKFFKETNLREYCEKHRCKHFQGSSCTNEDDPDLYFSLPNAFTTSVIACIGHLCQSGCTWAQSVKPVRNCLENCLQFGECFSKKDENSEKDSFERKHQFMCFAEKAQEYYSSLGVPGEDSDIYNIDSCHLIPLDDKFKEKLEKCIEFFKKFDIRQFCETNPYRCPYTRNKIDWSCSQEENDVEKDSANATYKVACAAWYCQGSCENDTECADKCLNLTECTNEGKTPRETLSCYLLAVWRFITRRKEPIVKTKDDCQLLHLNDGAFQTNMVECTKLFMDFDLDEYCQKNDYCEKFDNKRCDLIEGNGAEEKTYLIACLALHCYRICKKGKPAMEYCLPVCIDSSKCRNALDMPPQKRTDCYFRGFKNFRDGWFKVRCPLVFFDFNQQEISECVEKIQRGSVLQYCSENENLCAGLHLVNCPEAKTLTTGASLKLLCLAKACTELCDNQPCFTECIRPQNTCEDRNTVDSLTVCMDNHIKDFQRTKFKVGCPILKQAFDTSNLLECVNSVIPFGSKQFCSYYSNICNEFEENCKYTVSKYGDVTQFACVVKRCDEQCNSEKECVFNCIKPKGCLELSDTSEQLSCIEKKSFQVINAYKAECPILNKDMDPAVIVTCAKELVTIEMEKFCKNNDILCENVKSDDCENFTGPYDQLDTSLICVGKRCEENCQSDRSSCVSGCYIQVERCSREAEFDETVKCIFLTVRKNLEKARTDGVLIESKSEKKTTRFSTYILIHAAAVTAKLSLKF